MVAEKPDYYAILRPGASDTALDAYAARFGLELPTEFRQLYRRRDGQNPAVSTALVHNLVASESEIAGTEPQNKRREIIGFLRRV